MKPALVLFDFDYTLVDASVCLFSALRSATLAVGASEVSDPVLRSLIGIPLRQQFEILTGENAANFAVFERAYVAERSAMEREGTRMLPGVDLALAALKHQHFRMGIVSTGATKRIQRTLEYLSLGGYFPGKSIIGGAADKTAGIGDALRAFEVDAHECIYIGDRPDDGMAATRNHVQFIAVTTGAFERKVFPSGWTVLDSVACLPDYLARN